MIEINGLYKRYHRQRRNYNWVLEDINLRIPRGVSVGLLGLNGSGKSTLLRLIAGMDTPDRGELHRHCSVSWPIGLTGGFQNSMSGRQNVKFVARVHGGRYNVDKIIEQVQSFAELGSAFDEPIKTYSSGMRARLNFGLSLAFDFDIYLSDEATAVGDRGFKAKAKKAFRDKVGQASVIMVSHSEGILKDLCEAGIYLKEGKATWFDDINEAIELYHQDTNKAQPDNGKDNSKDSGKDNGKDEGKAKEESSTKPQTLAEAEAGLPRRKAMYSAAKSAFDKAKASEMTPEELKVYRSAFLAARERLRESRRQIKALQPEQDE